MRPQVKIKGIPFGGDYNPEQWPETLWEEDMRLLKAAHINIVTINVFSWAALQPSEETYDFSRLDKIMELTKKHGLKVCLATSTAAHPAWMAKRYPDILRTEFNGMKRKFGGRHNSCPNSPTYRKYSVLLAGKLAERYKDDDRIAAWHISNEYGGECYCENCEKAFRVWLKRKYKTLDALNAAWNTSFWSHTFYDWDEIVLPNLLSEHFAYDRTMFQGISLDYRRFNSDSMLECCKAEIQAIREITPDIPVTTNLMGAYKPLDYRKWAKELDFVSWDNYPANEDSFEDIAFNHDLMRGVKNGQSFWLMEQTPSVTNWLPYNELKRPGVMRLWSYQALAHGSDSVMYFQMRRSIGACEKMHGAVIDHVGNGNTRVYREVQALGKELEGLGNLLTGAKTPAKAAIIFDWDNWWALEYSAGPSCLLKYKDEILNYYRAFENLHISVDIISWSDPLEKYDLVVAPLLYMTAEDADERIRTFTKKGGTFATTFLSGLVDENDRVITGGYPGRLRDILGIWVEESDALPEGKENTFFWEDQTFPATVICDLLHCEGAESLGEYTSDFYAGMPALTKNHFGKGKAYYVAARSNADFYFHFLEKVTKEAGVQPVCTSEKGMEATVRENENGRFLFLLNHTEEPKKAVIPVNGQVLVGEGNFKIPENGEIVIPGKDVILVQYTDHLEK